MIEQALTRLRTSQPPQRRPRQMNPHQGQQLLQHATEHQRHDNDQEGLDRVPTSVAVDVAQQFPDGPDHPLHEAHAWLDASTGRRCREQGHGGGLGAAAIVIVAVAVVIAVVAFVAVLVAVVVRFGGGCWV